MTGEQFRQGDVLLARVRVIPASARVSAKHSLVLAEGELTGHAHRIVEDDAVMLTTAESATFVKLARKAELVHEEHASIELPAGTYRVIRQREYTPTEIQPVAD